MRNHYFGVNGIVNNETLLEYTVLASDLFFSYGIDWAAKKHAEFSSGRTYYMRYEAIFKHI